MVRHPRNSRIGPTSSPGSPAPDSLLGLRIREYATIACVLIEPEGIMDVAELVVLKNAISRMTAQGKFHIILNLRRVKHLNYVGLSVLAESAAKLRDFDGDLYLTGAKPYLKLIFKSVGLDNRFRFFPTVREALAAAKAGLGKG